MLRNFTPAAFQKRIARISVFLAGWEVLKFEIEDRLRDLYLNAPGSNQHERMTAYEREVLVNGQPRFEASLRWLRKSGALSEADVDSIHQLRLYHREVARMLPRLLFGSSLDVGRVADMKNVLNKLSAFWNSVNISTSDRPRNTSREHELTSIIDKLTAVTNRDHLIR